MTNFDKLENDSILKRVLQRKLSQLHTTENKIQISFEHYDNSQEFGSSFEEWEDIGLLSKSMEILHDFCCNTFRGMLYDDRLSLIGDFPPNSFTNFSLPTHVPPDAYWIEINVNGSAMLIGHRVSNVFYLVFLDKTRNFVLKKEKI